MPDGWQPPGLAAERTRLAWRRTTLGTATVALLAVARVGAGGPRPAVLVAIALIGLALLAILLLAYRRIRTLGAARLDHAGREAGPPAARRAPAVLALLVAVVALIGTVLVA